MCAGRPRSINSGNRTPKYSPSGTSPTSLSAPFPTSYCPYTKGAVMGRSALKYPVACYLDPGDRETILDVKAVMIKLLRGTDLIVAGDLNVDLYRTGGQDRYK